MNAGRKKWNDLSESERKAEYDALAGRPFWHDGDGRPYEVSRREFDRLYAGEQAANEQTAALALTPMMDILLLAMVHGARELYTCMLGDASDVRPGNSAGTAGTGGVVVDGV